MKIAVIGAGAMGRGIAQIFAQSGHQVLLHDARGEAIEAALARKNWMPELADDEIPVVGASVKKAEIYQ